MFWRSLLAPVLLLVATSGCGSLLGLDDFGAASGKGGGAPTTGSPASSGTGDSTSSGGEGGSGAGDPGSGGGGAAATGGGEGGGGEPCNDEGTTEACYDGAPDTLGVGACVAGERVCQGGMWTACEGQVLPQEEDLFTWTDESCTPGDAEVRTFVRYAGSNDDYSGGAGWLGVPAEDEDAVVAIGTYAELTIGGVTVSTEVDNGTALVRHRRDGSVVWVRGLSTSAPSGVATGNGFTLLRGYAAAPETLDGVTLDGEFIALVDPDGIFRDVLSVPSAATLGGRINGILGAYGRVDNTIRRYQVRFADMTVTATTDIDFGTQRPGGALRTSGMATNYTVVSGKIAGSMVMGGCAAQTTSDDSFIAVFSGTTQPVCVSLTTMGVTGSSTITGFNVEGDRFYVTGRFSGTLTDESGATLVSEGSGSAFVARMTFQSNGQLSLVWLRAFGGTGAVTGGGVLPDPTGGVTWTVGLSQDGAVDIGGVELVYPQGFVNLDAAGDVRYVRQVGHLASSGFRASGDVLLATGDLGEESVPFDLDPLPPSEGLSDAFFAILEAP